MTKSNIVSWFSLATATGLSVVSLGTPGLKDDLDEQVFTGGISAVSHLLSTEIGTEEKHFIGGGDTRKMGRFEVSVDTPHSDGNQAVVISQFLLISKDKSKIGQPLIDLAQEIATTFATQMALNPVWEDVETSYRTLGPLDVLETFIDSVAISRKKVKARVPTNDQLMDDQILELIRSSVRSFEFSEVLENIIDLEPNKEDVEKVLVPRQKEDLHAFYRELLALIVLEDPIPIIYRTKPNEAMRDVEKLFKSFRSNKVGDVTREQLLAVTGELFDRDIAELLETFSVLEMREIRPRIHETLADEIVLRISKHTPFLLLVNPSLKSTIGSFDDFVGMKVDEIFAEYDLASILGKIAALLLEGENPISQYLLSEFIRSFAMRFPGGLTVAAWEYVQTLFMIFSTATQNSLEDAVARLEISDSHLETINVQLRETQSSPDLKSLSFVVTQEGDEIVKFFNALQTAIVEGAQNFFNQNIWSPKQLGLFPQIYVEKLHLLITHTQYLVAFIEMANYLQTENWEYLNVPSYLPSIEDLLLARDGHKPSEEQVLEISVEELRSLWRPSLVLKCYTTQAQRRIHRELVMYLNDQDYINGLVNDLSKNFDAYINAVVEGRRTDPADVPVAKTSTWDQLLYTEGFRRDMWKNYLEITDRTQKLVVDVSQVAQQYKSGQKKEKDFSKAVSKAQEDFAKHLDRFQKRTQDNERKVRDAEQKFMRSLEREVTKAAKDLLKKFNQAIFKECLVRESRNKEEKFIIPSPEDICIPIAEDIESGGDADQFFPRTDELVSTFASIVIFNHLPRTISNDIINMALISGGRSSDVVATFINEVKQKHSESGKYLKVDEYLRKVVRNNAQKKLRFILETILGRINTSYFKGTIKTFPINSEMGEISCMDICEVGGTWLEQEFKGGIPFVLGPNLHLVKVSGQLHLFYEVEKFPSSGARLPVTRAVVQATWNEIIGGQMGLFIEILKMSAELLGEQRRKRFQEFLERIFDNIPYS